MDILRVYPNPWAAFDRNGVPCAVCPRDPDADAGGPAKFVGARIDPKNTRVLEDFTAAYTAKFGAALAKKIAEQEHRSPRQSTFYEYMGVPSQDAELAEKLSAKQPVEIPSTKYYKDRLREGSLIAADAATAAKARLPFVEPAVYFATRTLAVTLPETPGLEPLAMSPDATGNVLEGPALAEGLPPREGVTLPADGVARTVELGAAALPDAALADAESTKPKTKKPNQERSAQ